MNAPSVASAVNSTTLTNPRSAAPPMTPFAVILKPPESLLPVAPITSARVLLTLSNTPIASSASHSTDVATMITTKRTNETANANFIPDHGSMGFTGRRARRGPRPAAAVTVLRAARTASVTRAVLADRPDNPIVPVDEEDGIRTLARATAGPPEVGAPDVG